MPLGCELLRDAPPAWDSPAAFLLLNPRLDPARRDRVLSAVFPDLPGHVWIASSGSGGRLKVIALSRPAVEASARAVNAFLEASASDVWINPLPLFHAGGLAITLRASLAGAAWHPALPWDAAAFVRRAAEVGATLASLVPAQLHDLVRLAASPPAALRAVIVGGDALPPDLHRAAHALGWPVLRSYGLTEAASQVATSRPGDDPAAPLPLLPHVMARTTTNGLLELSGPSLLTGWLLFDGEGAPRWEDPKSDGWLRTRDRAGVLDGCLTVLGRADDLLKIRGELVDVAALERELQTRVRTGEVALLVEPDPRTGHSLAVIASSRAAADEAGRAAGVFPPYARPTAIRIGPIPRTPLGKIIRSAPR